MYQIFLDNRTIVKDTRILREGDWFLCEDPRYLEEAIRKNPGGIIAKKTVADLHQDKLENVVCVEDPRLEWARLSSLAFPGAPKCIIGVTGTNGKTSVAYFCYKILAALGRKSSYIGTLGIFPDVGVRTPLTTPDAFDLHKILDNFARDGVEVTALEISSSALERRRAHYVPLDYGIFTSFTQDHLDIHGDMDTYLQCKLEMRGLVKDRRFLVSSQVAPLLDPEYSHDVYDAEIRYHARNMSGFMQNNLQAACRVCEMMGYTHTEIIQALSSVDLSVPGRMEVMSENPRVVVDFAHTPDALEKILQSSDADKIVVFGCGGNRDKGKRAIMGEIANRYAKLVIVTDDNPRHEDPAEIRREIIAHCPKAIDIGDRRQAIELALKLAAEHNYECFICGKGHETSQIYGDTAEYFSDTECVREMLVS